MLNTYFGASENHVLTEILERTGQRLIPHLERVTLQRQQVLHEPNQPIRYVYFPVDTLVSIICVMENGASAETAIVGNDGIVGVAPIMGGESTPYSAVALNTGKAYRMEAAQLRFEASQLPALQHTLLRYTQGLLTQMAQNAACSRHHSLYQQLCRWLLLSIDRLPRPELPMTHESISHMLGVRRESITVAALQLQEAGIISYTRGRIRVLNRAKLEQSSCECYGVVRREIARLQALRMPDTRPLVRYRTDQKTTPSQAEFRFSRENLTPNHARRKGHDRRNRDRRAGADRRTAQGVIDRRQRRVTITFPDRRHADRRTPTGSGSSSGDTQSVSSPPSSKRGGTAQP